MEELYDPQLAQHHLEAQRARGGHHLNHLAAPLGQQPGEPSADQSATRAHEPEQPGRRERPATTRAGLAADQLLLEDL